MRSISMTAFALAAGVLACSSGPTASGGGGGTSAPTACTLNADCPLRYACHAGYCTAIGVDSKGPSIVSFVPYYGQLYGGGDSIHDVLGFTFDEPVRLGQVTLNVANTAQQIPADVTLSADEKTVTIVPHGIVAPVEVESNIRNCTDNWGNPCPYFGPMWSFPSWIEGTPASVSSALFVPWLAAAIDGSGASYVGWIESSGGCGGAIHVHRSSGTPSGAFWPDDSGALPFDPAVAAVGPSLAARGDAVAVSWAENGCNPTAVRVAKRVAAGSWALAGDAVRTGGTSIMATSLALDAAGNPVVAWDDNGQIHVSRFDGTAWNAVGGAVGDATLFANDPSIALGPGDVPCVAFHQVESAGAATEVVRAYCWDAVDAAWAGLGGGTVSAPILSTYHLPSMTARALAFDASGTPFVGWELAGVVDVASLSSGAWQMATVYDGVSQGDGSAAPDLAVDPTLGVVVGYGGTRFLTAASYGPSGWQALPDIVTVNSLTYVKGRAFAAGPVTGLWAAWDFGSTYMRSERYNQ